jgi:hypothetical protein
MVSVRAEQDQSDGEPGWQTIWKGWFVLMILVEGYELAQAITSPK